MEQLIKITGISSEMLMEANEYLLAHKDDDHTPFLQVLWSAAAATLKKCARKDYLAFAKSKKHSAKKIRKALRKHLGYVARDIRYPEEFMSNGYATTEKEAGLYLTITALYEQQKYMYGRIEKISFEAYNESTCLTEAVERFKERTGYYPNRVLADQIYRTRANRSYCKEHGIRLSGAKLGRPGVNVKVDKNRNIRIIPTGSKWNVHLA